MSFDEADFREERKLEHYIINNPKCIQDDLVILGHQIPTVGGKRIDILGVDSNGGLMVIELKTVEDDRMLMQGLEYVDWVNENADRIPDLFRRTETKIEPKIIPELILVAPSFSRTLITSSKYIIQDYCSVCLLEYIGLKDSTGKKGVYTREIPIKPIERPTERWNIDDYLDYFGNARIKQLFQDVIQTVQSYGTGIECNPTQSWYVALQYKGRNICTLSPRKEYFYLWIGEYQFKIEKKKDFTQEIREKIIAAYKDLGGKPKSAL